MEEIKEKVNYCLNCKIKPCSVKGCPLENNIPDFIKAVKEEEYKKAYEILSKTTVLPGICGKICPHMKQCQGSCVRGIKGEPVNIGDIENFIFEKAEEENYSLKEAMQEAEGTDTSKKEETSQNIKKISKTSTQKKNLLLKCKNKTDENNRIGNYHGTILLSENEQAPAGRLSRYAAGSAGAGRRDSAAADPGGRIV